MPSPVGHALGGFALGWLAARSSRLPHPVLTAVAFAALGVVPDLDVLVEGTHRLYTHSVAAVALVAILAGVSLRAAGSWGLTSRERTALAIAAAAAYGSHILLDWLGDDRSVPIGVRALWPFTDAFFQSDLRWFPRIERRYWLPSFWTDNLHAIGWELLLLSPLAILALAVRMRAPRRPD